MSEDQVAGERRQITTECVLLCVGILAALTALKHLGAAVPFFARHGFTIAAALQLYLPFWLVKRRGLDARVLGFAWGNWKQDLVLFSGVALLTVVPFALGHHFWQTMIFKKVIWWRLPQDVALLIPTQVLVVALPEELFFRGYLQPRFDELWPPKRRIFGTAIGRGILVASGVFGLAHFLGEYRLDRLGPFFPALVFGWLRARTGGLLAPVAYHAFCNVLSDFLFACYRSPGTT